MIREPLPTNKIRFVLRKNGLSMNPSYLNVLQQWWFDGYHGEWRDVQTEIET